MLDQKHGEKSEAALAEEEYENAEALTVTQASPSSRWILDSGCSCHMTTHREWLEDNVEKAQGTVHIGYNKACKMVGVGTMVMKVD